MAAVDLSSYDFASATAAETPAVADAEFDSICATCARKAAEVLAASAFPNMRAINNACHSVAVNLLMSADVSATSAFVASVAVAVASSDAMCCLSSSAVSSDRASMRARPLPGRRPLFEAWLLEVG